MKKKKSKLIKLTKETQEERKQRVSSGMKFRAAVFGNKKRKLLNQVKEDEKDEWY